MKIGFDAKRAFLNRTGLGNYSRWLISGLSKLNPKDEYYLYTPRLSDFYSPDVSGNVTVKTPRLKILTASWRSGRIRRDLVRDGIQVYHGLSHELPFRIKGTAIKTVVTIHDVIALRFPQYFNWLNKFIYKRKLAYACRVADKIIAVSNKTKEDIIACLDVDPKKIEVIYQGCDPAFKVKQSPGQIASLKVKYNLPEKYLLTVGTIEERKNILLVVKALQLVPTIKLVAIGKATAYTNVVSQFIKNHGLGNRVIFLHNVQFSHLPAIYQGAACFVYPSRYEGFGIPVLEALVSGIPVIAATGSCLEEAGGPDSLYVSPDDDTSLAVHINAVLHDAAVAETMAEEGLKYSANFDDQILIPQYTEMYKSLLKDA